MNEDSIYKAPLGEFVAVRNHLAATLKKQGAADDDAIDLAEAETRLRETRAKTK